MCLSDHVSLVCVLFGTLTCASTMALLLLAAVSCGVPSAPANGGVLAADYSVGTRVTYFCNSGYRLSSKELTTTVCQPDGTWSNHNKIPRCIVISCGNLPTPPNGKKIGTQTTFGASAIFSCNLGYVLTGSTVRECLLSGLWSGMETQCLAGHCGIPEQIVNGPIYGRTTGDGFNYNDVVRFFCNKGYTLEGPSTAQCQANRQWSQQPPTCRGETDKRINNMSMQYFNLAGKSKIYLYILKK
uniref:Sushi domain-containing protein n=1 Tax=Acanthochromis polyacanthus TaxID=80966 RepID=A0A3Q1GMU0_9TELE